MPSATAAIRQELEALCIEFWYRVDQLGGVGVEDLFTEDGVYSVVGGRNVGRAAIAESYVKRAARGPRLSRHVHSNLHVTVESSSRARGASLLTLWARDGEAPMPIVMPVAVSDVSDDYLRGDDGVWRVEHRHITPAFRGDEPPVLPFSPAEAG